MPGLTYDFDWMNATGVRGPELAATWARLRIQAGEDCLTRVLDERAKTIRDYVYVPLYPLAEWLAASWWFLTSEPANPSKENTADFYRRHALGPNREGYAYPDLTVIPSGARTQLAWEIKPSQWRKIKFLAAGNTWLDSAEFNAVSSDLIDRVIRRLDACGIDDTLLQEEWAAVQAADAEEAEFCRTAAGLGWDPYDLDASRQDLVIRLGHRLGALREEAIPALNEANPEADCAIIADAILAARKSNGIALEALRPVRDAIRAWPGNRQSPWETGYDWARRLRSHLNRNDDPLPNLAEIADALGETAALADKVAAPILTGARFGAMIDGVITQDDNGCPAFGLRRIYDNGCADGGRAFLFCRAVGEVLASDGEDALVTRARTDRQQRNRAFAAEFLAPSAQLRRMIGGGTVDSNGIDALAAGFGVPAPVIAHQLENHRIARVLGGNGFTA